MRSIIQQEEECFVCKTTYQLERHHCIYGRGLRPLSDKYGLTVWLCARHHRGAFGNADAAVHFNKALDLKIKQIAQRAFEARYPEKSFLQVFGKNYL